jgi:hypothetical protein
MKLLLALLAGVTRIAAECQGTDVPGYKGPYEYTCDEWVKKGLSECSTTAWTFVSDCTAGAAKSVTGLSLPDTDSYGMACEVGGMYAGGYWSAAQASAVRTNCAYSCSDECVCKDVAGYAGPYGYKCDGWIVGGKSECSTTAYTYVSDCTAGAAKSVTGLSLPDTDSFGMACEVGGMYAGGYWSAAQASWVRGNCSYACDESCLPLLTGLPVLQVGVAVEGVPIFAIPGGFVVGEKDWLAIYNAADIPGDWVDTGAVKPAFSVATNVLGTQAWQYWPVGQTQVNFRIQEYLPAGTYVAMLLCCEKYDGKLKSPPFTITDANVATAAAIVASIPAPPSPPPSPTAPPDGDDPCFARETLAISASGGAIPMASLKAGDLVMDGPNSVARVIVNQHREATFKSSLLEITHANGELSLTPDHVLEVDGEFVPARLASAGSKLGESEVSRVTTKAGEVINPLTTSGKILTQGGVLASTYPEWVAEYMLSSYLVPLPLSLSNVISYLFPELTQGYYDALIEPLVTKVHPKHLKAALPAALVPAAFLAADLALSAGFFAFSLALPMAMAAAIAVVALAKRK